MSRNNCELDDVIIDDSWSNIFMKVRKSLISDLLKK